MIIQSTRIRREGGIAYLAHHLLDKLEENESIEVLAGDRNSLFDAHALADLKRCRYSLRHISISPEKEMSASDLSAFLRMVDAEFQIGPERPRLLVRHIKHSRSHFHVAVAEVDPVSFRVLDCRKDYARLEELARRYEADHGENVQPSRAERREARIEGFSDTARKRAERTSPGFNRTRLKSAFAIGTAAFRAELKAQGLRLANGEKGAILVTRDGVFVAAANRAAGVRRNEFQKIIEGEFDNERLIGNQKSAPKHAGDGRTQHSASPAVAHTARNTGRTRPGRATNGLAPSNSGRPAASSHRVEDRRRQARSPLPAITGRRREDIMLACLNRELDELLRRAQELAEWIRWAFEPATSRLTRQIEEARRKRKSFPYSPAERAERPEPTYDYRRRTAP
ncbi:relaxase/mobilization nuclease domain-containing protein [Rhizobium sp. TRM95796]|uniref:relaxase/mobilization nuclease domain-containing protein n=1 Tax=Rhizobium sp. TRM95796 TaxID=2979862 RepID=UPI0021E7B3FC|nr:hypothetical protein [Rhizobium sp. TRM95796]MCV3765154.1 hypothetical protein [Rhizobium sp. TRM95796]